MDSTRGCVNHHGANSVEERSRLDFVVICMRDECWMQEQSHRVNMNMGQMQMLHAILRMYPKMPHGITACLIYILRVCLKLDTFVGR